VLVIKPPAHAVVLSIISMAAAMTFVAVLFIFFNGFVD
jgi:hypothetical protein